MSKFVLDSKKIAEYSNANPNALINTVPKYLVYGLVVAVVASGILMFGAAILAVL